MGRKNGQQSAAPPAIYSYEPYGFIAVAGPNRLTSVNCFMDFQPLQAIVGGVLFVASGYAVSLAAFPKKELDAIERVVLSLFFSISIPATVLLVANLLLGIRLDAIAVYAVYIIVTAAALFYDYNRKKHHVSAQA